jgi:hypothetical protein
MERRFLQMAVLGLCVLGVNTTAQAQQTPAADKTKTELSGCLQSSRADTTNADPKGIIYTLDVAEAASTTTPAASTTGTSAQSGAARAAAVAKTRYSLTPEASVDLTKHVGHHVQLTGVLLPPAAGGSAATATAATGAKPLPGAAHRMFRVTGLKMIAAKCP